MRTAYGLPRGQVSAAAGRRTLAVFRDELDLRLLSSFFCTTHVAPLPSNVDFYREVPLCFCPRVRNYDSSDQHIRYTSSSSSSSSTITPITTFATSNSCAHQGHMFLFPDYLCFDSRLIGHETIIAMPYSALSDVSAAPLRTHPHASSHGKSCVCCTM